MKKRKYLQSAIIVLAVLCAMAGCRPSGSVKERLDRAEACMNSDPGLALRTIDSIDSRMLVTRSRRARYRLLKSMILDKNFIDTTDVSLIMPAVEYYRRHGTPTDKMRAYMYLGRVYYNNMQMNDAMVSYMIADEFSDEAADMHSKALLMSSISETFSFNHNYRKALLFAEKAMDGYEEIRDSVNVWYSIGEMAVLHSALLETEKADTLFRTFMAMPVIDSAYYDEIVMEYACDRVLDDDGYEDVIKMCERSMYEFGKELSTHDLCVYALALERKGLSPAADSVLSIAENSNYDSTCINVWKYRIERNRGDYKQSLEYFENTLDEQNTVTLKALERSLDDVQVEYYKTKSYNLKEREKRINAQRGLLSCIIVTAILVFYIIYDQKRKDYKEKLEILSNLKEETDAQLYLLKMESDDRTNRLLEEKKGLSSQVRDLKRKYLELYEERFKHINELCSTYLSSEKRFRKDSLYANVKKQISFLNNDSQGQNSFEEMLNKSFDGIMKQFRMDFGDWKETDIRFVSYVMAGFESKTISCIMGITPGSVDVKKNRIRARIRSSSTSNREWFLKVMNRDKSDDYVAPCVGAWIETTL